MERNHPGSGDPETELVTRIHHHGQQGLSSRPTRYGMWVLIPSVPFLECIWAYRQNGKINPTEGTWLGRRKGNMSGAGSEGKGGKKGQSLRNWKIRESIYRDCSHLKLGVHNSRNQAVGELLLIQYSFALLFKLKNPLLWMQNRKTWSFFPVLP